MIKKIIKFLRRVFLGDARTWIDREGVTSCYGDKVTAPTVHLDPPAPKGWHIVDSSIVDGDVTVAYAEKSNTISVQQSNTEEVVELTITSRIFTKVNNALKKGGIDTITKELWTEFEDDIIEAQGSGKNTYKSLRHPVKKVK